MPELLEIESYRRLAEAVVDRVIKKVVAPDPWYLKRGLTATAIQRAVRGRSVEGVRRHGKVLLLDLTDGLVLGLRFGMTGRLLVDGAAAIERLEYGSDRADTSWDRFALAFTDGGSLVMRDPRRLGGVELDPDLSRLGPDALAVTRAELSAMLQRSAAPVKSLLMNQARLAGLGNLLVDEALFRAGVDPARAAHTLTPDEARALHRAVRQTLSTLGRRGGSHMGDHMPTRQRGSLCPKDGAPMQRRTVGGRTTWSCPQHQR